MPEVTSTIGDQPNQQLHLRRVQLHCTDGADRGRSWQLEVDVIRIGASKDADITLSDPTVSRRHAEIVRTPMGMLLRDLKSTNGTFVGPVRIKEVFLGPETRFKVGRTEMLLTQQDEVIDITPVEEVSFEGMVATSVAMRQVFGVLQRVAPTNLTVLITGETGTGKELASRAVHARSSRSSGPFVVFDCGAAPDNLIESELFGHRRGAFTGAVGERPGVFELAHGGTIFIDEIGELPVELQPKLLRVLEQREVRRLGDSRPKPVDVRVVAATNRALRDAVDRGTFREDLYYRLAVVEVHLPPLRDRRGDFPLLIHHMLQSANYNPGVRFVSEAVLSIFQSYHWPGNIRELKNCIVRALPFCDGDQITLDALPESLRPDANAIQGGESVIHADTSADLPFKDAKEQLIEAFERQYLIDLLARHDGNVSRAARAAQMDRKTITRLMKKHQLKRPS